MRSENIETTLSLPQTPLRPIIKHGILPRQCKAVLYASFKTGKSTLLEYIGMCIAGGLDLFGNTFYGTVESKVLVIQLEIPKEAYNSRIAASSLSQIQNVRRNFNFLTQWNLKLDTQAGYEELSEELERVQPDLLILDPLYKTISGNENSSESMGKVFDSLDILMDKHKCALLFSAQGRKGRVDPKFGKIDMGDEELRGSTAIPAWVDSIIGMRYSNTISHVGNRRSISFTLRHGDREAFVQDVEWDKQTGLYKAV